MYPILGIYIKEMKKIESTENEIDKEKVYIKLTKIKKYLTWDPTRESGHYTESGSPKKMSQTVPPIPC